MIHKNLNLLFSGITLTGLYFLTLFLLTGSPLLAQYAVAIIVVFLTVLFFVSGITTGIAGVAVAGLATESIFDLPTGTIIIASACTGLAMLHLNNIQSLSFPWRGTAMVITGTVLWTGLIELMHAVQPGESLTSLQTLKVVAWQGIAAMIIWLCLLIVYLGISSLFKQSRSTGIIP